MNGSSVDPSVCYWIYPFWVRGILQNPGKGLFDSPYRMPIESQLHIMTPPFFMLFHEISTVWRFRAFFLVPFSLGIS